MTRTLTVASLLLACACAGPTAPAPTLPPVTILAGQSNAIGLEPHLVALTPTRSGGNAGATAIACWAETGACWKALRPALVAQPVTAFVWWQGEMDILLCVTPGVYGDCPSGYGTALADLVRRVRSATGNPALPVVIVELGPWAAHWAPSTTVEADTRAWVAGDRHAMYVPTRDAEWRPDGIHMTEDGYRVVAGRVVGR